MFTSQLVFTTQHNASFLAEPVPCAECEMITNDLLRYEEEASRLPGFYTGVVVFQKSQPDRSCKEDLSGRWWLPGEVVTWQEDDGCQVRWCPVRKMVAAR